MIDVEVSRETMTMGAVISDCERYRYLLWRQWEPTLPTLVMIMLNPSTADAAIDDPTITRCLKRAAMLGCGRLEVVNLFAFRATDPQRMLAATDPVGPDNNRHLLRAACGITGAVICGWGMHGGHRGRDAEVVELLRRHQVRLQHLGLTKTTAKPKHPLYVGYNVKPQPLVGPY